jgi:hypothetical protein
MREYVPQWMASVQTSAAPFDGTDETDDCPSGGFGGGIRLRPVRVTPRDVEALKRAIVAAVTVDPERFDRAEYDRLTAQWDAYEAGQVRREELVVPQTDQSLGTNEAAAGSGSIQLPHQEAS